MEGCKTGTIQPQHHALPEHVAHVLHDALRKRIEVMRHASAAVDI